MEKEIDIRCNITFSQEKDLKLIITKPNALADHLRTIIPSNNTTHISVFLPEPGLTSTEMMFYYFQDCKKIDLGMFNTSEVITMAKMFYCCNNLESISFRYLNTSKVEDMTEMFDTCILLKSIDLSMIDAKNVKYMASMFNDCESLEYVDLRGFNITNETHIDGIFNGCKNLKTVVCNTAEECALLQATINPKDYNYKINFIDSSNVHWDEVKTN